MLNSTGSALSYTRWTPGEPNGGTVNNCALMYSNGYWNDASCGISQWSMCEKAVQTQPKGKKCKIKNSTLNEFIYFRVT